MTQDQVLSIFKEALLLAFKLAGPLLLVSLVVGLVVSVFQAATQIHEQTLSFVPKVIAVGLTLFIFGPWMMGSIQSFVDELYLLVQNIA